jgi:AraC-like DNA-binding protein
MLGKHEITLSTLGKIMLRLGQTNRNLPFIKYLHETQKRVEVPMHSHTNCQLNYVNAGTMHLLSPRAAWVVPWKRIVWIPPDQPHSVRCEKLSGSWKVMIPRKYAKFLPKEISVLQTTSLLLSALGSLPETGQTIAPAKRRLMIEVIKLELMSADREEFSVTLPKCARLQMVTDSLLRNPEDSRRIDDCAKVVGMSRRTFTRRFISETGSSFEEWRKSVLLGKALTLLAEGKSVSGISDDLGYAYPSAFIAAFKRRYGVSTRRFGK